MQEKHHGVVALVKRFFLSVVLLVSAICVTQAEERALVFGVVPQQAASKLAQLWSPFLTHLAQTSGVKMTFATAPSIPEFEKRLAEGVYDLAYMNPYHYTVFSQRGYRAFAREEGQKIRGLIVVRAESAIQRIDDLNGSKIAFPSETAFAASILPRGHLAASHVNFTPEYVSSHDSVYLAVTKGIYSAGGGIERTFNNLDDAVKNQLRVLWISDAFTTHAFAANSRVDDAVVEKVRTNMLAMKQGEQGKKILGDLGFKGIQSANDNEWDDVRKLNIAIPVKSAD